MKNITLSAFAGLALSLGVSSTHASMLDTATTFAATQTQLFGAFHDRPTGFVFVKLPQGWIFAGRDDFKARHDVFFDAPTGFVFVKLADGWKFVGKTTA